MDGPVEVALQLAPTPAAGSDVAESLAVSVDGTAVQPSEVMIPGMGRVHRLHVDGGRLDVQYHATVSGRFEAEVATDADRIVYTRPSRYAESDRLAAVAQAEFAGIEDHHDLLAAVSSWVGTRLSYVPGSSRPTDGAVETLLKRQGVCRDYAHLVVALLRALDVPARLSAVYAPGLDPMDFHAVAEAAVDGRWSVVDATLLAPRTSLLRICCGRDAADTAFLTTFGGVADLLEVDVSAVVDGPLPNDDVVSLVALG